MTDFRYGPVEFYLVGFEGDRPAPGTTKAIADLLASGLVRLLDLVIISKALDGTVSMLEIEEDPAAWGLSGLELAASGLAADGDVDDFAQLIPAGTSAALAAIELVFARELAHNIASAGGVVLATERVPAPIVNAVLDELEAEEAELEGA